MLNRRQFLFTAASAVAGVSATGLYTRFGEPYWLDVVHRKIPVRNLPSTLQGKTLVQLSDLHVGAVVPDAFIAQTFAHVRDLRPDIVAYTGDFITPHDGIFQQVERVYGEMPRGRLGTVGVMGNHDYGAFWSELPVSTRLSSMLTAAGTQMLSNSSAVVAGLQIVGMGELWAHQFDVRRALAGADPALPTLVLSHNPDTVDLPGWGDYDGWILSGHTHGGQCKAPFLTPPILPVRNKRYSAGEYEVGHGRRMYINRGIGHSIPVRFNARPEITVFTLESA